MVQVNWKFPETAKFGRVIPKEKLYQQAGASAALKQLFVQQVGQVKWAYKLAENTTNLAKTKSITEIEIIQITLKTKDLDEKILIAIDQAIPHPTLFVLKRSQGDGKEEIRLVAAHKTVTKVTNAKQTWCQSQYLKTIWLDPKQVDEQPLPTATNLQRLYEQLIEALMPNQHDKINSQPLAEKTKTGSKDCGLNRPIKERLEAMAQIEKLEKKLQAVKTKRDREKQFNRRRELNDDYKTLKQQIVHLQAKI